MPDQPPLDPPVGRHTPARGAHIYFGELNVFFLTVNAKDHEPWMAQAAVRDSLAEIWRTDATAWLTGYYLLMPDHLHLFCAPRDLSFGIDTWITYWKRQFSRRHIAESWVWQRSGFHHRLRHQQEYQDKWLYVRENPMRQGLAQGLDDWPWQGTIHELQR